MLTDYDWQAIALTVKLAATVTIILLVIGTPIAWSLARSHSRLKPFFNALIALPLVLPPTVIGFYLLIALGPSGWIGNISETLGFGILPFSFWGLVIASLIYSLPFVVQPIQQAFESIPEDLLEAAATLRASPLDRFIHVALPISRPGFIMAAIMGFAHTVGEFGVVLMIGGSIPGETKVVSIQLYEHVETLNYSGAHSLAAWLMLFSFIVLLPVYMINSRQRSRLL